MQVFLQLLGPFVLWVFFVKSPRSWDFLYVGGFWRVSAIGLTGIEVSFTALISLGWENNGKSDFGFMLFLGMTGN